MDSCVSSLLLLDSGCVQLFPINPC